MVKVLTEGIHHAGESRKALCWREYASTMLPLPVLCYRPTLSDLGWGMPIAGSLHFILTLARRIGRKLRGGWGCSQTNLLQWNQNCRLDPKT
jgi:hypothetical protein